MVPFAVTMVTLTGFSSCAALKNARLTYKAVFPLGAAGPQCSSAAKASLWLILELILTPCAQLLISQNIVCRSFFLEMYSHRVEPVSRQIYLWLLNVIYHLCQHLSSKMFQCVFLYIYMYIVMWLKCWYLATQISAFEHPNICCTYFFLIFCSVIAPTCILCI